MNTNRGQAVAFCAGSVPRHHFSNAICNTFRFEVKGFQIEMKVQIKLQSDDIDNIFIDSRSSVDVGDIIACGMIEQFKNNPITHVILLSHNDANKIYAKLRNLYKSFRRRSIFQNTIYFTLTADDFIFKFDVISRSFSSFRHHIFWDNMRDQNKDYFKAMNSQNKQKLNKFYDEFYAELDFEEQSRNMACCCCTRLMCKNHGNMYKDRDFLAKQCYGRAIERCGVLRIDKYLYIPINDMMDVIWLYLGSVTSVINTNNDSCLHCRQDQTLKQVSSNGNSNSNSVSVIPNIQPNSYNCKYTVMEQIALADGYNENEIKQYIQMQQLLLNQ